MKVNIYYYISQKFFFYVNILQWYLKYYFKMKNQENEIKKNSAANNNKRIIISIVYKQREKEWLTLSRISLNSHNFEVTIFTQDVKADGWFNFRQFSIF